MSLIATRHSLHLLAERVISPLRVQVTGNEIALQARPGGFGTPDLPQGGWVGVAGPRRRARGRVRRGAARAHHLPRRRRRGRRARGRGGGRASRGRRGVGGAARLGLGDRRGARWRSSRADDVEPIHLWPEHFDIATVEGAGDARANYGVSPGDDDHDEPYAYVGPWKAPADGDPFWNATAFAGAEAPVESVEQVLAFFREGQEKLRRRGGSGR